MCIHAYMHVCIQIYINMQIYFVQTVPNYKLNISNWFLLQSYILDPANRVPTQTCSNIVSSVFGQFAHNPGALEVLMHTKDELGREIVHTTFPEVRDLMFAFTLWHGRYRLVGPRYTFT